MKKFISTFVFLLLCPLLLGAEVRVLAFSGSTRQESYNQKLASEVANMAAQMGAHVTLVNLKNYPIPLYDGDLEAKQGMPSNAKQLRQMMKQSDIIVITSPEYNASVSGVLKNTLDWASRGESGGSSKEAFKDKKFILMAASLGSTGGARGLVHLKTIVEDIGGSVISHHIAIPQAYSAFDPQGNLINTKIKKEIHEILHLLIP